MPALAATTIHAGGGTDLGTAPPDLTQSVDPNIVVTFDDSGSMGNNYMGDNSPFNNGSWSGVWFCAGIIDPRITDPNDLRSHAMNGVYYNPNVVYSPPIKADGTVMPDADVGLTAVWNDGIQQNRPRSAYTSGTTNFTGVLTRYSSGKVKSDKRWKCPKDGSSPLDDSGGPYYYRLKSGVNIGTLSSVNTGNLYNSSNWEAVAVPSAEYQNWANWWAYYRTRNLMTRTALSRVFGTLGGNIRVAWQNINDGSFKLPDSSIITNLVDTSSCAASGVDPQTEQSNLSTTCYRSAFFNWIFQTGANGGTPDRASTIRAGEFFERGTGPVKNLTNPYWQPPGDGYQGQELACRQNFHMLVTDGYWNEGDPSLPSGMFTSQGNGTPSTLPDGTGYSLSDEQTKIFWNVAGSEYKSSLANIAFYYWAHDLRTDLNDNVPPYFPSTATGVTGTAVSGVITDPASNEEIYYNPANDPATWQHVVQFMVTLGVAGNLNWPIDLTDLRTGVKSWPRPVNNAPQAIDDTWHAAVNSRGSYFSAGDPGSLVAHLTDIINSILARRGSSTALSATMSTLTQNTQGFYAGYDTSDYSGFLQKFALNPDTGATAPTPTWDAGCVLTGGACLSTNGNNGAAPNPASRKLFTSNDAGTAQETFAWSSLSTAQQIALNQDPAQLLNAPAVICTSATGTTGGCDGKGQLRADWFTGVRTHEDTPPLLRKRSSLLGAIVNSQPRYVSSPVGGFSDNFPTGSAEAVAATPDANGKPGAGSYAQFVYNNRARTPVVYVGSNDGMLHAFNAVDGSELWAYIPSTLISNRHLDKITSPDGNIYKTAPGVDSTAVPQDVFINGAWHSVLIGSLRLGGRGIFALDVTDPNSPSLLWEVNNTMSGFADLGYTYSLPNVLRLSTGQWVVAVPSGYFPLNNQTPVDPASSDPAINKTSLFVIGITNGNLIREIKTSTAPQFSSLATNCGSLSTSPCTYGLSTAIAYDLDSNLVDDIEVAGDLAGNLWRFDLRDTTPANWKVDLMFETYASSADVGKRPITALPVGMRDNDNKAPVFVFGTGKYLGPCDNTAVTKGPQCGPDSNSATQAFYGVRDYGTASPAYPIKPANLTTWGLSQDASGLRSSTGVSLPATTNANCKSANITSATDCGWSIPLNPGNQEPGERVVVGVAPFYTEN
ncbi:MAG: PilC/PilY family type IV pilus protein, partial [Rudaea sp.]